MLLDRLLQLPLALADEIVFVRPGSSEAIDVLRPIFVDGIVSSSCAVQPSVSSIRPCGDSASETCINSSWYRSSQSMLTSPRKSSLVKMSRSKH